MIKRLCSLVLALTFTASTAFAHIPGQTYTQSRTYDCNNISTEVGFYDKEIESVRPDEKGVYERETIKYFGFHVTFPRDSKQDKITGRLRLLDGLTEYVIAGVVPLENEGNKGTTTIVYFSDRKSIMGATTSGRKMDYLLKIGYGDVQCVEMSSLRFKVETKAIMH
jgi:hypothetical protein